ncbi:hypothetical protein FHK92_12670 [Pseudomonas brassicacearum subsp. neoaurantiaca]|uniref:Uncharacterized protein n=1 Tax=Pseudomonas brassicacearum subsp. neoaurantiaca TaxID=494916 RepID=A0A7V8RMX6_9PSED|nr:hypothetical protein [Pseudomonas brassicacearum subsp. neoaurantiaca]
MVRFQPWETGDGASCMPVQYRKAIAGPLWERACSRLRCVSQSKCRLCCRYREQARSHRV